MKEKSDKKSSIKVPRDQLLELQRKLRGEDVLERICAKTVRMMTSDDVGGIATLLLFKEIRKFGDEFGTCGFGLCNLDDRDNEQWLSLPGEGLLSRFKVTSRQDKISSGDVLRMESKEKILQQIKLKVISNYLNPINT
jgi:hypothetical protein